MTKENETKLMIIENFIDHINPIDRNKNEMLKAVAKQYVEEDHVDEITQAGFIHKDVF